MKFNGTVATVQESVVNSIRWALEGGYELEPTEYFFQGDEVEVIEGPMKGTKGVVVELKGEERLVLKIDALQQAVSVHIDSKFLLSVEKKRASIL